MTPKIPKKPKQIRDDALHIKALIEKLEKDRELRKFKILSECFDKQLQFIFDPAKRKALCCNRRSGKSTAIALYMIHFALNNPHTKYLYIGLTNESAKGAMWGDILDTIIRKYDLDQFGVTFIESRLEIKFPNGSIIYLRGIDATDKQMNRVRGQKYQIVAIDEAQSFKQDLQRVIGGVLDMTIAENSSAILLMCGTPGEILGKHYWWQIWKPDSTLQEWSRFGWGWQDNTSKNVAGERVCDSIQAYVDGRLAANPAWAQTPEYRREVLGEWVLDDSQFVYKFNRNDNTVCEVPGLLTTAGVQYILSIDLGYYDATAFVIVAYNKNADNKMYVIESYKKDKLTITAVANEIKALRRKYNFSYMIVDAANTQAVEEMKQIHDLPLIPADKQGKEGSIAVMNGDFITGHIKIAKFANEELISELETLHWDPIKLNDRNKPRHVEDEKQSNHLTDALLYAWVFSRHYWYRAIYSIPKGSDEDLQNRFLESVMRSKKRSWALRRNDDDWDC